MSFLRIEKNVSKLFTVLETNLDILTYSKIKNIPINHNKAIFWVTKNVFTFLKANFKLILKAFAFTNVVLPQKKIG